MVRKKNECKTKLKTKPAKSVRSKRSKKLPRHASPQVVLSSSASDHDYTLPDGNYYDSFDKLRLSLTKEPR